MWALIAFIILGIVVATLIEINERNKARKEREKSQEPKDNCTQKEAGGKACSDCDLLSVCDKDKPKS